MSKTPFKLPILLFFSSFFLLFLDSQAIDDTSVPHPNRHCSVPIIPLFNPSNDHTRLVLAKDSLSFLRKPENKDRPVGVITMVGRERTGKSFTLNKITRCDNLFPVGYSTASKTKGLSYLSADIASDYFSGGENCGTDKSNPLILLIDSEGLGNIDNYDKNILFTSILLSNKIIYHLDRSISKMDLDRIYEVLSLIDQFQNNTKADIHLPELVWVVQNARLESHFHPDRKWCDLTNEEMMNELMENVLKLQSNPTHDPAMAESENTKSRIRYSFPNHHPLFFPPPCHDFCDTTELPKIPDESLSPKYLNMISQLRCDIRKTEPKRHFNDNSFFTCSQLADYIENVIPDLINQMNDGVRVSQNPRNNEYFQRASSICRTHMESLKFPMKKNELKSSYSFALDQAIQSYFSSSPDGIDSHESEQIKQELEKECGKARDKAENENLVHIRQYCDDRIREFQRGLDEMINKQKNNCSFPFEKYVNEQKKNVEKGLRIEMKMFDYEKCLGKFKDMIENEIKVYNTMCPRSQMGDKELMNKQLLLNYYLILVLFSSIVLSVGVVLLFQNLYIKSTLLGVFLGMIIIIIIEGKVPTAFSLF